MNTINTMANKTLALIIGASILSAGVGASAVAAYYSKSGSSGSSEPVAEGQMNADISGVSGDTSSDLMKYMDTTAGTRAVSPESAFKEETVYVIAGREGSVKKIIVSDWIRNTAGKTGVEDVADRLMKNLSKGYKQRVGMAQAFLGRPPLIILDEPTIGLDPAQIVQVRNILLSLKEQHTVLLSSHILSEIGEVCDEIVLINRGELVAAGTEKELVSAHTDAARYLIRAEDGMLALAENAARELCPEVRCGRADAETLELAFPKEKDPGLQLTDRLIEGGVRGGELYRKTRSLEDVFLELVNAADGNDGGRA